MAGRASRRKAEKPTARKPSKSSDQKPTRTRAAGLSVYTVFVSHSSKEKWIAGQISKEIEALGAKAWLDAKDLSGGDEVRRSIKRGIRASHEAVVLLSSNSVTSQWVIYEVAIADGQNKRVTPILIDLTPDEAPAPLQGIRAVDLNDLGDFLIELAGRIQRRSGKYRKARP